MFLNGLIVGENGATKCLFKINTIQQKLFFLKVNKKKKEKPPTPSSGRFSKWMLETTGNYSVIIDLNGMGLRSRSRRRDAPVHVEKFEAALHAIYWSFR